MTQQAFFPATVMPDQDWWHALWPDPDSVIQALRITAGMTVVDLGCGDGYFTQAIARQIDSGRVIGFDLDPAMLTQAQATCADMPNCDWLQGDAMALSQLITQPADYVLIANTFHGVPDKLALTREIAASLQPAGHFTIINWHPLPRETTPVLGQPRGPRTELRMSVAQTQQTVEPAGFVLEALVELPPYHYAAIFRKTA
ncbi:class I SAM-dependent methyltransferase [Sulfuriferula thiophila]|uniref:class I SAM-dependent methyltransferase n=1 Tax=Sulfuriferula thiophila TaxID=1781211 RepID=UPI001CB8A0B7|nr:class I SAM-dependent methyltransferase [Sulfuriferula thiophila]